MVAGRTTESRTVTVTTTNASASITAASGTFNKPEDVGRTITGTGIPAGATITAVASSTAATISANATASGSPSVVLGPGDPAVYGFRGWSPESDAESETYSIAAGAGASAPSVIANTYTRADQRARG
jgi:hypothetical protein